MPQLRVQTWMPEEKPLPQMPASPTLTNPDHILPSSGLPTVSSPPRLIRRPPSPSYLRDRSDDSPRASMGNANEKLGLVGRKMLLLRNRAPNGGQGRASANGIHGSPSQGSGSGRDLGLIPSSPILQDVGNLAPEQSEYLQPPESDRRSISGGSSSSEISGMAAFLAKYRQADGASEDETSTGSGGSPAPTRFDNSTAPKPGIEAERRKQQEDEYTSAILSKRAEEILANAKKRLNVMEGNLRGARDLVAPLTAANLKRATSLGSAHYVPSYGRRYGSNGYDFEDKHQQPGRMLHTQASSPTMGRDYQGHARGFSENELQDRPITQLDSSRYLLVRNNRNTQRDGDFAFTPNLRSSRSHDTLGSSSIGFGAGRERSLHARDSPDSGYLETLREADESRKPDAINGYGSEQMTNNGLGIYRPSSTTSDLREQMTSLKGRISSLKERARTEKLRRQSETNLRSYSHSPFNNALADAPEFYYSNSSGHNSPVPETNNAEGGWPSGRNSAASLGTSNNAWNEQSADPGSRNALAEHNRDMERGAPQTLDSKFQTRRQSNLQAQAQTLHKKTPSGTTIIESAKNRFSHHRNSPSQDTSGGYADDEDDDNSDDLSLDLSSEYHADSQTSSAAYPHADDGDTLPEEEGEEEEEEEEEEDDDDDTSVYEDASNEPPRPDSVAIAHEDREDAFDYEHFFLLSAMGAYGKGRRGSQSSDASASSTSTAKGPAHGGDEFDNFDPQLGIFPPPTPETPERLRQIEHNLHQRKMSDDSISTLATYATADEALSPINASDHRRTSKIGRAALSPLPHERQPSAQSLTRPETGPPTRSGSRPGSRASAAAVKRHLRRDSDSDRADSGVGLSRRSIGSNDSSHHASPPLPPGAMTPKAHKASHSLHAFASASASASAMPLDSLLSSPPLSPRGAARQDPAAIAVNALLNPNSKPLGLRNNALLFGIVESLRQVVQQLQDEDESQPQENATLSRKLDQVKLVLDGRSPL